MTDSNPTAQLAPTPSRRTHPYEFKVAAVAALRLSGGKVKPTAGRLGISPATLREWRTALQDSADVERAVERALPLWLEPCVRIMDLAAEVAEKGLRQLAAKADRDGELTSNDLKVAGTLFGIFNDKYQSAMQNLDLLKGHDDSTAASSDDEELDFSEDTTLAAALDRQKELADSGLVRDAEIINE